MKSLPVSLALLVVATVASQVADAAQSSSVSQIPANRFTDVVTFRFFTNSTGTERLVYGALLNSMLE
jgi:hypothetical protein